MRFPRLAHPPHRSRRLPRPLQAYLAFLEKELQVPVRIVSVGPDRVSTIMVWANRSYICPSRHNVHMVNLYQVLGLPFGAPIEQVRKTYREFAKHFHPDKHQGSKFFTERFKEIQSAYETLSDDRLRFKFEREFRDSDNLEEVSQLKAKLERAEVKLAQCEKKLVQVNAELKNLKTSIDSKGATEVPQPMDSRGTGDSTASAWSETVRFYRFMKKYKVVPKTAEEESRDLKFDLISTLAIIAISLLVFFVKRLLT